MDIERIAFFVTKFRNAIDEAIRNGETSPWLYMAFFDKFPLGCCGLTSDMLAEYLLENGIKTKYVSGIAYEDVDWDYDHSNRSHAWLLYDDTVIIDITGDQFKYSEHFYFNDDRVYVGNGNKFYDLFKYNEKRDVHDIYPLALGIDEQRIYRIIMKYIR